MAFRLRRDARDQLFRHFLHPKKQIGLDFDIYYFCLMAGLSTSRKRDAGQLDIVDLVQGFPGPYREKGRLIVGVFLSSELNGLGIDRSDRKQVHDALRSLVSPASPSYLSDEGEREFNKYAHGGVDVLAEWFGEPPQTLETFLPTFRSKIAENFK